jgi:hypothetical protein
MCAKCTPRLHKDEKEERASQANFGKREKKNGKVTTAEHFEVLTTKVAYPVRAV